LVYPGGSLLYRETTRDAVLTEPGNFTISEENLWAIALVHEIGHQFGLVHPPTNQTGDGKVMSGAFVFAADTAAKVEELQFGGKGLRKIITNVYPEFAASS